MPQGCPRAGHAVTAVHHKDASYGCFYVTMTLRLEAEAEKERGSRLGVAGERENERAKEGRSIKELQVQFLFL